MKDIKIGDNVRLKTDFFSTGYVCSYISRHDAGKEILLGVKFNHINNRFENFTFSMCSVKKVDMSKYPEVSDMYSAGDVVMLRDLSTSQLFVIDSVEYKDDSRMVRVSWSVNGDCYQSHMLPLELFFKVSENDYVYKIKDFASQTDYNYTYKTGNPLPADLYGKMTDFNSCSNINCIKYSDSYSYTR